MKGGISAVFVNMTKYECGMCVCTHIYIYINIYIYLDMCILPQGE